MLERKLLTENPWNDDWSSTRRYWQIKELPQIAFPVYGRRYGLMYSIWMYPTNARSRVRGFWRQESNRDFLFQIEYNLFNSSGKCVRCLGWQRFIEDPDGFKETSLLQKPRGFENNFKT